MAANLYHLLAFIPAVEAWEMPRGVEQLAARLVTSGKLRVNAEHERNFVRYGDMTFTTRELTDPSLSAATRARLARHVAPAAGPHAVEELWQRLRGELKKARGISSDKELRVARVLVQSTHPSVMELVLRGGAEIYVSYSHNVADLMPVHAWQNHGQNSGLQATDSASAAIYVSAGGDPFFEGEQKTYTTDGYPALARMVVIAGQELGHFADLRRNAQATVIGRYSTDINASQLRADPTARVGRERDMQQVQQLSACYAKAGLRWLRLAEQRVEFYHKRRRFSPPWLCWQLGRALAMSWFALRCKQLSIIGKFRTFPPMMRGATIEAYLADMQYNLAPDAEVYRDPDPLVEEAIAVIEAVARVPQQVHKWGYSGVAAAWPGLTGFYYGTVLAAAQKLAPTDPRRTKLDHSRRVMVHFRRICRTKPGYYP